GPAANVAGHDMNYQAQTGLLALSERRGSGPLVSPPLIADIGGGSYPAVINILMALLRRANTGAGCRIEIAMANGLYPFLYWALADGFAAGKWPQPDSTMLTGASCRYCIWRTADGRYLSAAPIEERFWREFCDTIGLDDALRDDTRNPAATRQGIAESVASRTAAQWQKAFADRDACVTLVATLDEAVSSPLFAKLFARRKACREGRSIPALPLPLAPEFVGPDEGYSPSLGEANADYLTENSS
ncbi:MAG: CoA transferase, partial [Pseudorhodoplanes sp.]|nr:CoA transferase [Pseudorhodoplanes sp.]